MKKALLILIVFSFQQTIFSQNDRAIEMHTYADAPTEKLYISTLPSGENIIANTINDLVSGNAVINIKRIDLNGIIAGNTNLIITDSLGLNAEITGLSCSATGEFTCFLKNSNQNLYLIKFSSLGNVIWQKLIYIVGPVNLYYEHSFVETTSGDYYINISDYSYMGIIKIDSNGNVLWNKKILGPMAAVSSTPKSPGFFIAATPSGGCIALCKDDNNECIVCLNSDGSKAWSKSFVDGSYRWPKAIKFDSGGNIRIMGTSGSINSFSYVQKMSPSGNIISAKIISDSTSLRDMYVTITDEVILVADQSGTKITKLDASFNHLWSKKISNTSRPTNNYPSPVFSNIQTSNISFLTTLYDTTHAVMKFSGNPSELCNTYNSPPPIIYDDTTFLAATVDTGLAISSFSVSSSDLSFTISAEDYYTSNSFCNTNSILEQYGNTDLSIYPNPASNELNINISVLFAEDRKDAIVSIYDITGKIILEKNLDDSPIQTTKFPSGIYNVMIRNSTKVIGSQRVIIQK